MKSTYEYLPIESLKTAAYNRPIDMSHVRRIVSEFDENRVKPVVVSLRKGVCTIIDGQHTVAAMKIVGVPVALCRVFRDLTYMEEAQLFVDYNRDPKKLYAFDIINGLYEAKDEATLAMYECVQNEGMKIGRQCAQNTVTAVASLRNVFEKFGAAALQDTLHVIKQAWNGEKESLKGDMIDGMALALTKYNEMGIDRDRLVKKLKTAEPVVIFRAADSDPMGGMKKYRIARAIIRQYNLNKHDKLPDLFVK